MGMVGVVSTYFFFVFFYTGLEAHAKYCPNVDDACILPKDAGPCRAAFKRYFFDKTIGQCKQFIYGGCLGNKNNFLSLKECKIKCPSTLPRCLLPVEPGPCYGYFPAYYYDACTGRCKRFTYGGCLGNKNIFSAISQCYSTCAGNRLNVISSVKLTSVCYLPKETGPCRGYFIRYFYDKSTARCQRFVYGGCQGNKNNFKSFQECNNYCHVHSLMPAAL